jgi:hypothetical protein
MQTADSTTLALTRQHWKQLTADFPDRIVLG